MVYLFDQLEPEVKHEPVPLCVDNSGVISLVQNPVDHQANKHIHSAREMAGLGVTAPALALKIIWLTSSQRLWVVLPSALWWGTVSRAQRSSVRGELTADPQSGSRLTDLWFVMLETCYALSDRSNGFLSPTLPFETLFRTLLSLLDREIQLMCL